MPGYTLLRRPRQRAFLRYLRAGRSLVAPFAVPGSTISHFRSLIPEKLSGIHRTAFHHGSSLGADAGSTISPGFGTANGTPADCAAATTRSAGSSHA
jgi:hypothetical protein